MSLPSHDFVRILSEEDICPSCHGEYPWVDKMTCRECLLYVCPACFALDSVTCRPCAQVLMVRKRQEAHARVWLRTSALQLLSSVKAWSTELSRAARWHGKAFWRAPVRPKLAALARSQRRLTSWLSDWTQEHLSVRHLRRARTVTGSALEHAVWRARQRLGTWLVAAGQRITPRLSGWSDSSD